MAGGLIGSLGSYDDNSRVVDCKYDGKSISGEGVMNTRVGGLIGSAAAKYPAAEDDEEPATISRSFANVDGILYGSISGVSESGVGGILGYGSHPLMYSAYSTANNLLSIANRISSVASSSGYARSGDIIGYNTKGG